MIPEWLVRIEAREYSDDSPNDTVAFDMRAAVYDHELEHLIAIAKAAIEVEAARYTNEWEFDCAVDELTEVLARQP